MIWYQIFMSFLTGMNLFLGILNYEHNHVVGAFNLACAAFLFTFINQNNSK